MKMFRVVVNGNEYKVGIEEINEQGANNPVKTYAAPSPRPAQPKPAPKLEQAKGSETTSDRITAPMPGTILRVAVNAGDRAIKGQTLMVLEAMKMENEILAPADCMIREVAVTQGVSVNVGDTLVVMSS
ncbi:MAG: biotin/lipoyl attachment protein [uncultured bacterium]|nr:MAG: biotin/lipoyl attachment protein [uncultured bacterium]